MLELEGRIIDDVGQVILNDDGIIKLLHQGKTNFSNLLAFNTNDVELYNKYVKYFSLENEEIDTYKGIKDKDEFDKVKTNTWLIPDEYLNLDIETYILSLCNTNEEILRVEEEFEQYKKLDMINILRCLLYIVNVMREHNIVWGVGRGSACSSYILYLLDVHRVDSIKYGLDYKEFFKTE